MQDNQLFSGSLKDNIMLSTDEARENVIDGQTDDPQHKMQNESVAGLSMLSSWRRLQQAERLVEIHEHILSLPMGYQTPVGEMSVLLSKGLLQGIFSALALYREPKLLELDQGTAHLDPVLATKIFSNIKLDGTTVIYVTHSRQLLPVADRLFATKVSPNGKCHLLRHRIKRR